MSKEASLNEIKRVRAQNIDLHNQLSKLLDGKKEELRLATQQLYVQIENFRVQQMSETRNEVAVGIDFAIKALPWWKRMNRKVVLAEAFGYMVDIREMAQAEMARQKAEVDAEAEKIKREREAENKSRVNSQIEQDKAKQQLHMMATAETPVDLVAGPFDRDGNEVKG